MNLQPADPRHGTYNGYVNLDCRCQPCRDANTKAVAAFRAARIERLKAGLAQPVHGRYTTYQNWMCRCEPCHAAMREKWRSLKRVSP